MSDGVLQSVRVSNTAEKRRALHWFRGSYGLYASLSAPVSRHRSHKALIPRLEAALFSESIICGSLRRRPVISLQIEERSWCLGVGFAADLVVYWLT
jgi:hypothetical protein